MTESLAGPALPAGIRALRWAVRRARAAYRRTLAGAGPTWDVLAVTAADERQAEACLQELQMRLEAGLLPRNCRVLALPDPGGLRIGSGGAARRAIAEIARDIGLDGRRVLIIHSGGDSRRVPHCAPLGKLFMHLPSERDDGGPASLFDLLYVFLAGLAGQMRDGVLIASGDVLLTFDPHCMDLSEPGFVGVAIRAPQQVGTAHGVYVPDVDGRTVRAFLQKPTPDQMRAAGAVAQDGLVPVDTGLIKLDPPTASALVRLPLPEHEHIDLYSDILPALPVSADLQPFLQRDPERAKVREAIWQGLRGARFTVCIPSPAQFTHFGTTREVCTAAEEGSTTARIHSFTSKASSYIEPGAAVQGATVIASVLTGEGRVGVGALVDGCRLTGRFDIGPGAAAVGIHAEGLELGIRPGVCLHELPVVTDDGPAVVWRLYGVDDNPKLGVHAGATVFGTELADWLSARGIAPDEIWSDIPQPERCLWNARLYPIMLSRDPALILWMQDPTPPKPEVLDRWRKARRVSMAESAQLADTARALGHQHRLANDAVRLQLAEWVHQEAPNEQIVLMVGNGPRALKAAEAARDLAEAGTEPSQSLVRSRLWHLRGNILRSLGTKARRRDLRESEANAFAEVSRAIESGVPKAAPAEHWAVPAGSSVTVECPARVDFGGGWSDTPPHCQERGGAVLNAAVLLDGGKPVRVWAKVISEPVIRLRSVDQRRTVTITRAEDVLDILSARDSLGLHRAALVVSGVVPEGSSGPLEPRLAHLGGGIELHSQCIAPKGSGLGTSSILGWALLTAIHRALGRQDQPLIPQVLLMEQMLTTGGGWQDQAGGSLPGIKLLRTSPGIAQDVTAEHVPLPEAVLDQLHTRLVLFYTGKRRLAKNILRTIMGRWLSRDPLVVYVLSRIKDIASEMKQCLLDGNLDRFGRLMAEHWELNKLMDPKTTDAEIERLFAAARPYCVGGKLAGAGGGGFMILLARDADAVAPLCQILTEASGGQGRPFAFELDLHGPSITICPPSA